jgi:hypothetical protein
MAIAEIEMGLAAGGGIQQVIEQDLTPFMHWDSQNIVILNVQILNASFFSQVTGLPRPESAVTASAYAKLGYPFFQVLEEPSGIVGSFEGIETVARKMARKGENMKMDEREKRLRFPSLIFDKNLQPIGLCPVSQIKVHTRDLPRRPRRSTYHVAGFYSESG